MRNILFKYFLLQFIGRCLFERVALNSIIGHSSQFFIHFYVYRLGTYPPL